MLHFDISHPTVTRGSCVSRTPPHHTLPAFLNLSGRSKIWPTQSYWYLIKGSRKDGKLFLTSFSGSYDLNLINNLF